MNETIWAVQDFILDAVKKSENIGLSKKAVILRPHFEFWQELLPFVVVGFHGPYR